MKKSTLGFLILPLIGCLTFCWWYQDTSQSTEAQYQPRVSQAAANHGYQTYINGLRANWSTGKVEPSDLYKGLSQAEKFAGVQDAKAANLQWQERGPDNIGGRTRAIMVVKQSPNQVYSGGVSGGLWWSDVQGNFWHQMNGFQENLAVSSIAQTGNGRLFVATGCTFDSPSGSEGSGSIGNGIYYTDAIGNLNAGFTLLSGSEPTPQSNVSPGYPKTEWNRIVADVQVSDKLWAGGNAGLYTYSNGSFTEFVRIDADDNSSSNFNFVGDIVISKSGSTIIVAEHVAGGVRTHISYNAGATWKLVSTNDGANGTIVQAGVGRATYAISPDDNYENYIYCSQVNSGTGSLKSIWHSMDGGSTWDEIATGGNQTFDPFTYLGTTIPSQGIYDQCITVVPGHPDEIMVGGISLHKWKQVSTNPSNGGWEQAAYQGSNCQVCVHSDVHWFEWDLNGNLYIGTDGGVYKSTTDLALFYPANRGYNITQFYAMAYSKHDAVMGGTQDNGTLLIDGSGLTGQEAGQVLGADGFECEISFVNHEVLFASIYNSAYLRSDDRGDNWSGFLDSFLIPNGPFYTTMALWENPNDLNSPDSVTFTLNSTIEVGDTIFYASGSVQTPLEHVATQHYDSLTEVTLIDPVQSLFAGSFGPQGVYVTRDALRFAKWPDWHRVADGADMQANVHGLEFSADGDHLFIGANTTFASNGTLYRVSGLNDVFTDDDADNLTTFEEIFSASGPITDIAVDPEDADHVVITYGGFSTNGSHVYESTNATQISPTFTSIDGNLPSQPAFPVYGAVIDRDDPSMIIIGTEYGVYATDDGGQNWTDQNATMDRVPVFDVRQQYRTWTDGAFNPGMIYLGTHGRGIWSSASLLSVKPIDPPAPASAYTADLQFFPNPVASTTEVHYELTSSSPVELRIYDLSGKLVMAQNANGIKGENKIVISRNGLNAGQYLVTLQTSFARQSGKMIVQ